MQFSQERDKAVLINHMKNCKNDACQCRTYATHIERWEQDLTLLSDDVKLIHSSSVVQGTWLVFEIDHLDRFVWCCLACSQPQNKLRQRANTYASYSSTELKYSNLIRHQRQAGHCAAVQKMLGLTVAPDNRINVKSDWAPTIECFKCVFVRFQEGQAPSRDGYCTSSGIVGREKAWRMLWILATAHREKLKGFVRAAASASILRDERHGRMHLRIRTADATALPYAAFLGQSIGHLPSSLGLTKATRDIFIRFCTQWHGADKYGAAVKASLDQTLFDHMCQVTEAITVDSASNEVTAAYDLSTAQSFLPKCRFLLRDSAHGGRRILERPWKADSTVDDLVGFLFHWRDSLGQIVHHSHDLKLLFKSCSSAGSHDTVVSSHFGNLRCAKHRIETSSTPLSRFALDPDHFFDFAVKVSVVRKGTREGRIADVFLSTITCEMVLLVGMLADAASEALLFIRSLDTESMDIAAVCEAAQQFLCRVTWLFHNDQGCLHVNGHTKNLMAWLAKPHYFLVHGKERVIGGSPPTEAMLQTAFDHMRAWTVLARDVIDAEIPHFDLVSSMGAFACLKDGTILQPATVQKLRRLERGFKVKGLVNQFQDHLPIAAAHNLEHKCSNLDSWRYGIELSRVRPDRERAHPCDSLLHVLIRYACFAASTSRIEQSFSKLMQVLTSQRLNADYDTENMAVELILATLSESELDILCRRAQTLWMEAFPRAVRTHAVRRKDAGLPHKTTVVDDAGPVSERKFLKRLQEDVSSHVSNVASRDDLLSSLDAAPAVWTDKHDAEQTFQKGKMSKRMVEAHLNGLSLESEVTDELTTLASKETARRYASLLERVRHESKIEATLASYPFGVDDIRGSLVFTGWLDAARRQAVLTHAMACGGRHAGNSTHATVFIIDDAAILKPPLEAKWVSTLVGGWLVTVDVFLQKKTLPL